MQEAESGESSQYKHKCLRAYFKIIQLLSSKRGEFVVAIIYTREKHVYVASTLIGVHEMYGRVDPD